MDTGLPKPTSGLGDGSATSRPSEEELGGEAGAEQPRGDAALPPESRERTRCFLGAPVPGRVTTHNPSTTSLSTSVQPRQPHSAMAFAAAAISGLKTP